MFHEKILSRLIMKFLIELVWLLYSFKELVHVSQFSHLLVAAKCSVLWYKFHACKNVEFDMYKWNVVVFHIVFFFILWKKKSTSSLKSYN